MGGQVLKININNWLLKKWEQVMIKFLSLKLKILSICVQMLESCCIAQKRSIFIQQISMCSFFCAKKFSAGWMGGGINGSKSRVKDCLQQSKNGETK